MKTPKPHTIPYFKLKAFAVIGGVFAATSIPAALFVRAQSAPPQQQECALTTRAFGSAAYVVTDGNTEIASFQRWDTALRRAVTEEARDPRRDIQIRMAVRVECPGGSATVPDTTRPPVAVVVDSVIVTDIMGRRGPFTMKTDEELQLCARVFWSDGKLEDTCSAGVGLNFQDAIDLNVGDPRSS